MPPVALLSQLRSLPLDHSTVNQQLNQLQSSDVIRGIVMRGVSSSEIAYCRTEDYQSLLLEWAEQYKLKAEQRRPERVIKSEITGDRHGAAAELGWIKRKKVKIEVKKEISSEEKTNERENFIKQQTASGLSCSHEQEVDEAVINKRYLTDPLSFDQLLDIALLFQLFSSLLLVHRESSIRREKLIEQLFYKQKYRTFNQDQIIRYCLSFSLLLSRDEDSFWFFLPGLGELTLEILNARKEIYQIIRKKKYKEIFFNQINKIVRLKSSERGMKFHLMEMIGAGKLEWTQTNMGTLLTIPKALSI